MTQNTRTGPRSRTQDRTQEPGNRTRHRAEQRVRRRTPDTAQSTEQDPGQNVENCRLSISVQQLSEAPAVAFTNSMKIGPTIAKTSGRALSCRSLRRAGAALSESPAGQAETRETVVLTPTHSQDRRCSLLSSTPIRDFFRDVAASFFF